MAQHDSPEDSYAQYVEKMKQRTKEFALRIIKLCQALTRNHVSRVIGGQLLRAGTGVGSNYRAACRARTAREFTAKIRIVLEEADESHYWLVLITDSGLLPAGKMSALTQEANELVAIFTSAHTKAARISRKKGPPPPP